MLGIKSENTEVQGNQASSLIKDMQRWSKGEYTPKEKERIKKDHEILNRFKIEWKD